MMTVANSLTTWMGSETLVPADGRAQDSDYELAQQVARGRMDAFERLYLLHQRRVYSLCLRMTKNVAEAEDLTQEVFLHLYRKAGSFRGESSFTTWLHRLTINQVLMHFRRSKIRREDPATEREQESEPDALNWMQNQVALVDRVTLDSAIAQLPPGYRMVFLLHDALGYEHEEIAALVGCAVGTSKSQLHKARMKLRRLLKERKAVMSDK